MPNCPSGEDREVGLQTNQDGPHGPRARSRVQVKPGEGMEVQGGAKDQLPEGARRRHCQGKEGQQGNFLRRQVQHFLPDGE